MRVVQLVQTPRDWSPRHVFFKQLDQEVSGTGIDLLWPYNQSLFETVPLFSFEEVWRQNMMIDAG